ncbi:MAG: sodium:proline symporter [Sandaracinus sp.]|nr:sodium:proline symporter [Sandaracinus sp.]
MNQLLVTGSFALFLVAFTLIGALSARQKEQDSPEDYLVASRNVSPWLVALSAISTNNSGYMFIGLIGFAWRSGIEALWINVGWIFGDFVTWLWVHKRVRARSEDIAANTVPGLLATDENGKLQRPLSIVAGLLTFLFLGGYAAAQLKAGSTTLHALFDWPLWLGAVIGVVIVTVYCFAGGIRASIWTDAAQSIVMIGAMALLLGYCVVAVGGPSALLAQLEAIDPQLVQLVPSGLAFGFGLYLLGLTFGGIATIGQPHILIRFMAIDATDSIRKARNIYFVWYIFFSVAAFAVGLYSRVLLPDLTAGLEGADAVRATEAALPTLTLDLLPPVLVGVMLAGLFAATMSTADSQLLSCSGAVTQDVFPRFSKSARASKVATLSVAILALIIALVADAGVFSIVLMAWSILGAAFGPILIVRLAGWRLPAGLALVMMAVGVGTVVLWGASPWAGDVFKALPGLLAPMVVYGACAPFLRRPSVSPPPAP